MAYTVARPKLNWRERMYLPAIVGGLAITLKHFTNMLLGRTKITMQYPEEKWDSSLPDHYRGAPALVREFGRACALGCLSAMRIHLSAARDQNYSRRDSFDRPVRQSRKISRGIRYRHDSLHFLRDVRGGLSGAGDFSAQGLRHHWIHAR
jgi:hypothetical protein